MAVLPLTVPRTGFEPNLAGTLASTVFRRPSLCSLTSTDNAPTITLSTSHSREPHREFPASPLPQQQLEVSDARAGVYHSEREDTPPTSLVGSGRAEGVFCSDTRGKRVETWFVRGKDKSPMKEGELKGKNRWSLCIAASRTLYKWKNKRSDK